METDLSKEKEFGAGTTETVRTKKIANLKEILEAPTVELELENGSIIEAKHLGALDYQEVMRRFPLNPGILNKQEKLVLEKAYARRGDDDREWLISLSEEEQNIISKVVSADASLVQRTAAILSVVSVNPTMTEPEAVLYLKSFQNPNKFSDFCAKIQKLTETPEDEIKNC